MADAEIIPIGTRGRPGRGTGTDAVGRGPQPRRGRPAPHPTSGEAARPPETRETRPESRMPHARRRARPTEPTPAAAPPAATTRRRGAAAGIPVGDWLAAFQFAAKEVFGDEWEPQLAEFLAFLRRRVTGDYDVDEYGFDAEVTERFVMAALRPIAQKWFRVEVRGVENIPAEGGALVVSNHSGTIPVDGLMTMVVGPRPHRPAPASARRRPGLPDADRQRAGPQGRRHAGLQRGRRADAPRRRARRGLARGVQGDRQALLRALQAAAVRPRRLRLGRAAHRRADRPAARWSAPRRSTRWWATSRRWPGCWACPTSRSRRSSRCSARWGWCRCRRSG